MGGQLRAVNLRSVACVSDTPVRMSNSCAHDSRRRASVSVEHMRLPYAQGCRGGAETHLLGRGGRAAATRGSGSAQRPEREQTRAKQTKLCVDKSWVQRQMTGGNGRSKYKNPFSASFHAVIQASTDRTLHPRLSRRSRKRPRVRLAQVQQPARIGVEGGQMLL
eukprot:5073191-Pleurochrysis_carterae.AAC.1